MSHTTHLEDDRTVHHNADFSGAFHFSEPPTAGDLVKLLCSKMANQAISLLEAEDFQAASNLAMLAGALRHWKWMRP